MDISYRMIYKGFEKKNHTREKPKANMFEGYSMQDTMGFFIIYIKNNFKCQSTCMG